MQISEKEMSLTLNWRAKMKALVIEDEVGFLDLLVDAFEFEEFTVKGTPNGKEAIKAAEKESFDVIVCDLNLPDIHGLELLACLKGIPNCLNTLFFIVSGMVDAEAEQRLEDMGIVQIISKPVRIDKLLELIKDSIEEQQKKLDPDLFRGMITRQMQSVLELELQNLIGHPTKIELRDQLPEVGNELSFSATCPLFGVDFWGSVTFYGDAKLLETLARDDGLDAKADAIGHCVKSIAQSFSLSCHDELNGDVLEKVLWRKRNYLEIGEVAVNFDCEGIRKTGFVADEPKFFTFSDTEGYGLIQLHISVAGQK